MSDMSKEIIQIKDKDGKVIGWVSYEEHKAETEWLKNLHDECLMNMINGCGLEISEEDKYLRGISGVITKERGLVFQHDDGKLYEPEVEYPALMIPLTEITEKLTVIRGATGFDF